MSDSDSPRDEVARLMAVHEPSDHEELIMFLERDQLVADTSRPVPRARLGQGAKIALWGLRIFVLVVSFMVIYTFVHQLG